MASEVEFVDHFYNRDGVKSFLNRSTNEVVQEIPLTNWLLGRFGGGAAARAG
jgi:hypothetical protein